MLQARRRRSLRLLIATSFASWSLLLVSGCRFLLEFTAVRRPCRVAGSSGQAKLNNRTHFSASHMKNEGSDPPWSCLLISRG